MKDDKEKRGGLEKLSNIEENAKTKRSSTWLMRVVIIFLVLVFLGGIVWGASDLVSREGTEVPPDVQAAIAEQNAAIEAAAPKTDAAMLACIADAAQTAIAEKPQLRVERSYSLQPDTVRFSDADTLQGLDAQTDKRLQAAAALVAPALVELLNSGGEVQETQFGSSIDGLLKPLAVDEAELAQGSTCTYYNYICAAYGCGYAEEVPPEKCSSCGAQGMYVLNYLDDYTFALPFAGQTPQALALFDPPDEQDFAKLAQGAWGDTVTLVDVAVASVKGAVLRAGVQRAQQPEAVNKLQYLQFDLTLELALTLQFTGELSSLGTVQAMFVAGSCTRFDLRWPQIVLEEETYSLEKRGGVTLKIQQTAPPGTQVYWESSDESAATVDAQGNVSAGKTLGVSAEITAYMEVNGVRYQDSCVITVKNDVENIKLNKRSLTLQAGQSAQLQAKISPRDATIKDVRWFTRDANIATVDAGGKVHAVMPGVVEIYALSVDGDLKSTCTLTVEGVS